MSMCQFACLQARAAVLTASQCATYDEIKQAIMRLTGLGDHFGTHLSASMVTGLVTTTATAPVDVIKTHMFVGKASNLVKLPKLAQDLHALRAQHNIVHMTLTLEGQVNTGALLDRFIVVCVLC